MNREFEEKFAPHGTVIYPTSGKTLDEDGKWKTNDCAGFTSITRQTGSDYTGQPNLGLNSELPEGRTSILIGLWTGVNSWLLHRTRNLKTLSHASNSGFLDRRCLFDFIPEKSGCLTVVALYLVRVNDLNYCLSRVLESC